MNKKKWIRIILAVMLIALIATLAACGPKEDLVEDPDPVVEVSLTDELVAIIRSISPLVTTINGIEESSTLGVDAAIGVDYTLGDGGEYAIGAKANVRKANPEVELTVQDRKNSTDPNWILLSYTGKKAYLKQPLTSVNGGGLDTTKIDLDAFDTEIGLLMEIAMLQLAKLNINLDFDAIAQSLDDLFESLPIDFSEFIIVTKNTTTGVTTLTIKSDAAKSLIDIVYGLFIKNKQFEGIIDTAINWLMKDADGKGYAYIAGDNFVFPNISVQVGTKDDAVNLITLGIDYTDVANAGNNANKYAKLVINLKTLSLSTPATITPPDYVTNSMNLSAMVVAPAKDVEANLDLYVTGDMSQKTNILVNGALTAIWNTSATDAIITSTALGRYNGQKVDFDIGDVFNDVGVTAENSVYQASADMYTELNKAIVKWNAEQKAKMNEEPEPEAKPDANAPTMMQELYYDFLGGTDNLGKDDPSAKQMLSALDGKIGKYIRFDIKKDDYADAIKVVENLWNEKKDTIKSIVKEDKKWADVKNKGEGKDGEDWWTGTLTLTKAGDNNDLLDVVNMFLCQDKKEDGTPIDIDAEFLTGFANKYLALIIRSSSDNLDADSVAYMNAVEKLDNGLLIAKNKYRAVMEKAEATDEEKSDAEAEYKLAKDNHYKALKFENGLAGNRDWTAEYFATKVMKQLFGYDGTLAQFIDGGVTVMIGCQKGGGLNGGLYILGDTNSTEDGEGNPYFGIVASMKIVAKTEATAGQEIETEGAVNVSEGLENQEGYEVIARWKDGTKKIDLTGSTEDVISYLYETEKVDGETVTKYHKKYPHFEEIQANLWDLLEVYKQDSYKPAG